MMLWFCHNVVILLLLLITFVGALSQSKVIIAQEIKFNKKLKDLISQGVSDLDYGRNRENAFNSNHPNKKSYSHRQVRNNRGSFDKGEQYIQKAENMLYKALINYEQAHCSGSNNVLRPNHFSFGIIINGWAKIGEATKAETVLRKMEDLILDAGIG